MHEPPRVVQQQAAQTPIEDEGTPPRVETLNEDENIIVAPQTAPIHNNKKTSHVPHTIPDDEATHVNQHEPDIRPRHNTRSSTRTAHQINHAV